MGCCAMCSRDELQAVIAHEMGHVKNLDVRLMTFLAALVGAVALMSDGMGRMLRGGARFGALTAAVARATSATTSGHSCSC